MMKLVEATDPILLGVADKVKFPDLSLVCIATEMRETMVANRGCGLAAPQVGIPLRMFVYDDGIMSGVVINPTILPRGSMVDCREGCLTYPGKLYRTQRAHFIWCNWFDTDGVRKGLQKIEGFRAIIFQHEVDHLWGRVLPQHGQLEE
jgi:peptide deformylase